ncbi:MAG: acyclic terpene utilization AtuA family protein, partial [Candidatus Kapaibacteriota bacterium]
MKTSIRIASGQGFWGDLQQAPFQQVSRGPIDYLVMDYLAEVTMSILQKQRMKNPELGYARDLIDVCRDVLPYISERGIKLITNGGGVNPVAAKDRIFEVARELGISGLKIGVITGDDILPRIDELLADGHVMQHMETGLPMET